MLIYTDTSAGWKVRFSSAYYRSQALDLAIDRFLTALTPPFVNVHSEAIDGRGPDTSSSPHPSLTSVASENLRHLGGREGVSQTQLKRARYRCCIKSIMPRTFWLLNKIQANLVDLCDTKCGDRKWFRKTPNPPLPISCLRPTPSPSSPTSSSLSFLTVLPRAWGSQTRRCSSILRPCRWTATTATLVGRRASACRDVCGST